jgi:alkylation response protein AidB-like acyl-CoA dehydrogenase
LSALPLADAQRILSAHRYSPYYNSTHFALARWARSVRETFIDPNVDGWYEAEGVPASATQKWGELGMIAIEMPKSVYNYLPKDFPVPAGLDPHKIDSFHHLVLGHEFRSSPGIGGGNNIGLPPIINFGSEEMKKRIVPAVCWGKEQICLAITEPTGGSDVQNLQTTAKLSEDGKHFIVNGLKKWISVRFLGSREAGDRMFTISHVASLLALTGLV